MRTITVKELIEKLLEFNEDDKVIIYDRYNFVPLTTELQVMTEKGDERIL